MKRHIECARCMTIKRSSQQDIGYCQDCYDHIEHICSDPMAHAVAARAIIGSYSPGLHQRQMTMAGFLGIFHPELSHKQRHELIQDIT